MHSDAFDVCSIIGEQTRNMVRNALSGFTWWHPRCVPQGTGTFESGLALDRPRDEFLSQIAHDVPKVQFNEVHTPTFVLAKIRSILQLIAVLPDSICAGHLPA